MCEGASGVMEQLLQPNNRVPNNVVRATAFAKAHSGLALT